MKTILIADDAVVFRHLQEGILRHHGYAFLHASDGAQTVKLAVDHQPDLILLDIQMPVMDGVQVLSFLTKHERTSTIPVVVVTTIGREHDQRLLLSGGAQEVLTKPIHAGALSRVVRQLLGEVPRRAIA